MTKIRIVLLALLVSIATFGTTHAASPIVDGNSELSKSRDSSMILVVDGASQTTQNVATFSSKELHYVVTPETQEKNRLYAFSTHEAAQSFLNNTIKTDDVSVQSSDYMIFWDSETTSYAGSSLAVPVHTTINNLASVGWDNRITSSQIVGRAYGRIYRGVNLSNGSIGPCPIDCYIVWGFYKNASSLEVVFR